MQILLTIGGGTSWNTSKSAQFPERAFFAPSSVLADGVCLKVGVLLLALNGIEHEQDTGWTLFFYREHDAIERRLDELGIPKLPYFGRRVRVLDDTLVDAYLVTRSGCRGRLRYLAGAHWSLLCALQVSGFGAMSAKRSCVLGWVGHFADTYWSGFDTFATFL
jgi:hypothetical protein